MVLGGFRSFHVSVLAQNGFKCRKKKKQCPLDNNCLITSVIYKANVTQAQQTQGQQGKRQNELVYHLFNKRLQ